MALKSLHNEGGMREEMEVKVDNAQVREDTGGPVISM